MKKFTKSVAVLLLALAFILPMCAVFAVAEEDGTAISVKSGVTDVTIKDNYIYLSKGAKYKAYELMAVIEYVSTSNIAIYNNSVVVTSQDVAAGNYLRVTDNNAVYKDYYIYRMGDVNIDDKVDADDYAKVVEYVRDNATLSDVQKSLVVTSSSKFSVAIGDVVKDSTADNIYKFAVSVTPNAAAGISYLQFDLEYDEDAFKYLNKTDGVAVGDGDGLWSITANAQYDTVQFRIYKKDFKGLTAKTDVVTLNFQLINTEDTIDAIFKVKEIKAVSNSGEILTSSSNVVTRTIKVNTSNSDNTTTTTETTTAATSSESTTKSTSSTTSTATTEDPSTPVAGPKVIDDETDSSKISFDISGFSQFMLSSSTGTSLTGFISLDRDVTGRTYSISTGSDGTCNYTINRSKDRITFTNLSNGTYYATGKTAGGVESEKTVWAPTPNIAGSVTESDITSTTIQIPRDGRYKYSLNGGSYVFGGESSANYLDSAKTISIMRDGTYEHYVISGLKANTEYTLRIYMDNNGTRVSYIEEYKFTTKEATVVTKPIMPSFGGITSSTISLAYNSNLSYRIGTNSWTNSFTSGRYPDANDPATLTGNLTYYFNSSSNPTYITFDGLNANTTYTFYVKYATDAANTTNTNSASTKTSAASTNTAPEKPVVDNSTSNSISFEYEKDSDVVFKIDGIDAWTTLSDVYPTRLARAKLGNSAVEYYYSNAVNPKTITFVGLKPGTEYKFTVKYSSDTSSRYTETITVTTESGGDEAPDMPRTGDIKDTLISYEYKSELLYRIDELDWVPSSSTGAFPTEQSAATLSGGIKYYFDAASNPKYIIFAGLIPDTPYTFSVKLTGASDENVTSEEVTTLATSDGHKHNYVLDKDASTPATCTEDGENVYRCTICGDSYTEPVLHTGHNWKTERQPATCTSDETVYLVCTKCGAIDEASVTTIPNTKLPHEYEWVESADAEGVVTRSKKCKNCGHVEFEVTVTQNRGGSSSYNVSVGDDTADISEIAALALTNGCEELVLTYENGASVVIARKNISLFTAANSNVGVNRITSATPALNAAGYDFGNGDLKFAAYDITASVRTAESGNLATVKIKFELDSGKKQTVYHVSEDGKKEKIDSKYQNGEVVFSTNHFSTFVVEQTSAGSGGVVIAIIAVAAVLIATLGTFGYIVYTSKKRKNTKKIKL